MATFTQALAKLGLLSRAPGRTNRATISPWQTGALSPILATDVYGIETPGPLTRAAAMTVPAMVKARWLICTVLARHPLAVYDGETRLENQPSWLTQTSGQVSPQARLLWTLDDLLFTGYSLWLTQRDEAGAITAVDRVPRHGWQFNAHFQPEITGYGVPSAAQAIIFTSPLDPILEIAAGTLRGAISLERNWQAKVRDPIATIQIRQTDDTAMFDDEPIEDGEPDPSLAEGYAIAKNYLAGRRNPETGNVVVVPHGWLVEEVGKVDPALFENGRNAVSLDIARFTGIPASLLDAAQVTASLTYETQEGNRSQFADYSLAGWALPIEERLSMDDVLAPGLHIRFDPAQAPAIAGAPGPARED